MISVVNDSRKMLHIIWLTGFCIRIHHIAELQTFSTQVNLLGKATFVQKCNSARKYRVKLREWNINYITMKNKLKQDIY